MPELFHFSEDPGIERFVPRPVRVPSPRPPGMDWLNGPLVWAIDAAHSFLYFFPRDCPRILTWARPDSKASDIAQWLGASRAAAYVEAEWLERVRTTALTRYRLDDAGFEDLRDAGMWVSRHAAPVLSQSQMSDLPDALATAGVVLRSVESLAPLLELVSSSLHVSAIRLRNARRWPS